MFRRRRVLPMLDPRYTRLRNTPPSLTDPTAGADGSVGDGAPQFASQIDAAKALQNRLHGDGMAHDLNTLTPVLTALFGLGCTPPGAPLGWHVGSWEDYARTLPRNGSGNYGGDG